MKLPREDKIKSALVSSAGALLRPAKSPDEALGELFSDVQKSKVYEDGMTFVDLIPRRRIKQIQQEYMLEKQDPNFDLRDFVARHFYKYGAYEDSYHTDPTMNAREHINELWHVLERKNRRDRGSLIALPYASVLLGQLFYDAWSCS
jgi:alpha,alpha-trehalase